MLSSKLPILILTVLFVMSACAGSEGTNEQNSEADKIQENITAELVILDKEKQNAIRLAGPIRQMADELLFTEGPVWVPEGYLLFTDVPANRIYRWDDQYGLSLYMEASGLDPKDAIDSTYLGNCGANGLLLDYENRLLICQHGNRRLVRIEPDSSITVLADRFRGKRFNSPNDVAIHSNGDLYFTDPPYGLPQGDQDPAKELAFNGVYRLSNGKLSLLDSTLSRPNGLAFSPDEKHLYVAVSDPQHKVWYRYDVTADGMLENKSLFHDVTAETAPGLPDGMVVDAQGRLFATGPGGVWVFEKDGSLLARIQPPESPANCTFGGKAGNTLFMTARTGLYAVEVE